MFAAVFDAWARFILRHRLLVTLAVAALTVFAAKVVFTLPILTTISDFLPADTVGFSEWQEAQERFGSDEVALLLLQSDAHFTDAGIQRLKRLSAALEAHPFVEHVQSVVSSDQIFVDPDDPDSLLIEPFLRAGRSADQIRQTLVSDPNIVGKLVSLDGRSVSFLVHTVPNRTDIARRPHVRAAIEARTQGAPGIAAQLRHPGGERRVLEVAKSRLGHELIQIAVDAGFEEGTVHAAGFMVIVAHLVDSAERNLRVLLPLTIVLLALSLILILRRPIDAILPLVAVGPAVVWAVAIGGSLFGRLSVFTSVAPVMVLVVGVSDAVHLVTQFRHECARGLDRSAAIVVAFRQVGSACVLTSLTTGIGFGSMVLLPLPPARELGIFAAVGVAAAFVSAFVLTPVLLSFSRASDPKTAEEQARDWMTSTLDRMARFSIQHRRAVVAIGLFLTLVGLLSLGTVNVENSLTGKLHQDHPARKSVRVIEAAVGAGSHMELLIDTGVEEGVFDPVRLNALRRLLVYAQQDSFIVDATSILNALETMHRTLNPGAVEALPSSAEALAQYMLLFEISGSDDLEKLVDPSGRYLRVTLRTADSTAEHAIAGAARVEAKARALLPGDDVVVTGIGVMSARIAPRLVLSSLKGFGTALLLIGLLMALLFRSLRIGFLSLIPNVLPVACALFAAGLVAQQFDADSLAHVAICIGVAVDDTIHFLARYRIERSLRASREAAIIAAVREAGHGIARTSLVLAAGFAVLLFADYDPVMTLGVMLITTMFVAVLLDLTLVPAMAALGMWDSRSSRDPS